MIVSVWGNNGCGSSTLALKLGLAFSEMRKRVIVIDTNFVTPQTKIWFPTKDFEHKDSMSVILANNIELDNVAGKITMINDYLGVLGYHNELSINAVPRRDDTPSELLSVLTHFADVIIVDCQPNITQDVMSFIALDSADVKLINMSPDLRGLSWYNANVMMLKDKWISQRAKIITALNKVKPYSPVDAVDKAIGNVDYYLMYADELEEELYSGEIGNKHYKGSAKKYGAIVNTIAADIIEYNKLVSSSGVIIQTSETDDNETNASTVNIEQNSFDNYSQTSVFNTDEFNPK